MFLPILANGARDSSAAATVAGARSRTLLESCVCDHLLEDPLAGFFGEAKGVARVGRFVGFGTNDAGFADVLFTAAEKKNFDEGAGFKVGGAAGEEGAGAEIFRGGF